MGCHRTYDLPRRLLHRMGFKIAQSTAKTSTSTHYKGEARELHGTLQDQEMLALNLPRRQFRHTRWSTASALPPSTSNLNVRSQLACQQRPTLSRPPSRPSITQTDVTKDLPRRRFRHNKIHHSNQTSGRRHANQADKSTSCSSYYPSSPPNSTNRMQQQCPLQTRQVGHTGHQQCSRHD